MVTQLSVQQLNERLTKGGGPAPVVVDVREPWEVNVCAMPGAKLIPMRQIPGRLEELPRDGELVIMCHHGVRSQHVAQFLNQQGFSNVFNLSGGIDAWAKEIDRKMAVY